MAKFAERIAYMQAASDVIRYLFESMTDPDTISFGGGAPAQEALPVEIVHEIASQVLTRGQRGAQALQYGNPVGLADLRQAVIDRLLAPKGHVRQTTIIGNYIVATGGAFTDSGTRTIYLGNGSGSTAYDSREFASALTDGSFRLERSAAAASSEPFVVIEDSNTGSGTPVTLKVITGRAAGSFLPAYRGGSKYFDVQANGQVVLQTHRTGTAAPTAAANYVGELFVDTSAKKLYVATATGSSRATDDWTILN